MMSWLQRLLGKQAGPAPLKGARPVRREKTYSADSGYVYQYYYEGYRDTRRGQHNGQEHVFSVTVDRVSRFPIAVFLSREVIGAWEQASSRELTPTELYAIAKMSLFQAFDERGKLGGEPVDVVLRELDIAEHCATLDL